MASHHQWKQLQITIVPSQDLDNFILGKIVIETQRECVRSPVVALGVGPESGSFFHFTRLGL